MKVVRHKLILVISLIAIMMQVIQIKGQPFVLDQNVSDSLTDIFNGDVLWGDYDGDGDLDILIAGSTLNGAVTEIYKNEGSNYAALNLGLLNLENSSVSWCDFDSDNDLDFLLMGTDTTGNKNLPSAILYQNIGNDNFEQFEAGLLGVYDGKSAWGDLDNDGDQDLIMVGDKGEIGVTRIYRNNGATLFDLVDNDLSDIYNGDVALGDYDNDMDLDILMIGVVVNSAKEEEKVLKLYRNEGDFNFSGVYSEFVGMSESCLQWADYDSDGNLDIIANGSTEAPTHLVYLYQNMNNDNFLNIGIEIFGTVNGSVSWGDYDVDGDFDFLLTGMPSYGSDPITEIYRNINVNLFNKDDSVALIEVYQSQANWGDYDNDGDLDIVMAGITSQNNELLTVVYNNQNETTNTPPSTPSNIQSDVTGNSVLLS
ncbi:MAG: VCBS repeat-containing protein [Bacteroidales bacterium]|nr:VCBS repeat-containing protein [Bacteroidales bacterium]